MSVGAVSSKEKVTVRCKTGSRRCLFFFFSSRRRHTRLVSDWSSDVCSSDLARSHLRAGMKESQAAALWQGFVHGEGTGWAGGKVELALPFSLVWSGPGIRTRSEERRVGKEGRCRWAPCHQRKK